MTLPPDPAAMSEPLLEPHALRFLIEQRERHYFAYMRASQRDGPDAKAEYRAASKQLKESIDAMYAALDTSQREVVRLSAALGEAEKERGDWRASAEKLAKGSVRRAPELGNVLCFNFALSEDVVCAFGPQFALEDTFRRVTAEYQKAVASLHPSDAEVET